MAAQLGRLLGRFSHPDAGRQRSGRLRAGADEVPGTQDAPRDHPGHHDHAAGHPGAADLPGTQPLPPDRHRLVGDTPVLLLSVRRVPGVHLLREQPPQGPAVRRADRRLHGMAALLPHRAPARQAGGRTGRVLQLRGQLEQFLPALSRPAEQRAVPRPGGPEPTADLDAVLQPRRRRRTERDHPELALAIIIAILPVLVLFVFSQRTLVSGMLAGASKE